MTTHYPDRIRQLPAFEGHFEARKLAADGCDVLFASYPAGAKIARHSHPTENYGVVISGELRLATERGEQVLRPGDWYRLAPNEPHWARFEIDTAEIEFWFDPGREDRA